MKKIVLATIGVFVVCLGILVFITPDHIKISDYIEE